MQRLVITGSGMATARLLTQLAARSHDYQVEVIGAEPQPSYNRILLSALLAGEKSPADLALLDGQWYADHGIDLHTGEAVTELDVAARHLQTSSGRRVAFDRLVLATGSRPFLPPVPGLEATDVLVFRSQADLDRIRGAAASASRAVIIGGGLLGLEAAHGLIRLGLSVTVVNREEWLMPRQLDAAAAQVLQQTLAARGMQFRLGTVPIQVLREHDAIVGVLLQTQERLDCDLLLVAAGIVPECELARGAGVPCRRGILVNEHMETSLPGIYALGECCEVAGQTFGLVAPVNAQAEVLAAVLCGDHHAAFHYRETPTRLKLAGVEVISAGSLPFSVESESQIVLDRHHGIYRRLVFQHGSLAGFVLVGDGSFSALYGDRVAPAILGDDARGSLMFGGWDSRNTRAGVMN